MSCVTSETKLVITEISWLYGIEKDKVVGGSVITEAAGSNSGKILLLLSFYSVYELGTQLFVRLSCLLDRG